MTQDVTWKTTLDATTLADLKSAGYAVTPSPSESSAAEQLAIVKDTFGTFSAASRGNIQAVALANVANTNRGTTAAPMWVVYVTDVPLVPADGDPAKPEMSQMAVFLDPESRTMVWAVQY